MKFSIMGFKFSLINFLIDSLLLCAANANQIVCPFQSIYQFGDSISDTGNLIRIPPIGPTLAATRLPYGETFPGRPTGRFSDGLLIIDFEAAALGLPLLNPYLDRNASFVNGVNFAVAGSTALDFPFFVARGVQVPSITVPLNSQINWFKAYLSTICTTPLDCEAKLRRSLFFVGEIGGNDLNYALGQGKTIQELQTYVPFIIQAITNATREVIRAGARRIVVPGNFPFGCFPFVLSLFPNATAASFDDLGCLKDINNLAIFQNNALQTALNSLSSEFPNVVILYADYYGAFQSVLRRAFFLGFNTSSTLQACCGIGRRYNYDPNRPCGSAGVPVCPDPRRFIHWDDIHPTQEAYRRVAQIILGDILLRIQCF